MRGKILALFLYAGTTAFCQSVAPAPVSPDEWGRSQPAFTPPAWDFNKLPSDGRTPSMAAPKIFIRPGAGVARPWNDARIDPKMIVHPPPSSLGVQPPGTLVAQSLYPNLRFLPVEWPRLKLQPIPTQWPKLEMSPATGGTPATVRVQAK
jgi:hypothetical protein